MGITKKSLSKKRDLNIFTVMLLLILMLIYVFPFYWMVTTSVKTLDEAIRFPPTMFPLTCDVIDNYVDAFKLSNFLHYAKNSVIVTSLALIGQLMVIIPASYAFAKKKFRFKSLIFAFILFDMMIPGQVTFIPIYVFLSDLGWMDTFKALTIPGFASSFGTFFITQSFRQISNELIDAAKIDNASEFHIITRIMVPLNKPVIITMSLFTIIGKWNDYFWPLILTNSPAVRTLPIAIKTLFDVGGGSHGGVNAWNISMAGNVMLVAPLIIIYILANNKIKQAFVYGGIK